MPKNKEIYCHVSNTDAGMQRIRGQLIEEINIKGKREKLKTVFTLDTVYAKQSVVTTYLYIEDTGFVPLIVQPARENKFVNHYFSLTPVEQGVRHRSGELTVRIKHEMQAMHELARKMLPN